jgi:ankyrin repeat protein
MADKKKLVNQEMINKLFAVVSEGKRQKIERFLLENSMDMRPLNDANESVIHVILNNSNLEEYLKRNLLEFAILNNANINHKNSYGQSPLHLACKYQLHSCVEYLIKKGANINETDTQNKTPLHYAVIGVSAECNKPHESMMFDLDKYDADLAAIHNKIISYINTNFPYLLKHLTLIMDFNFINYLYEDEFETTINIDNFQREIAKSLKDSNKITEKKKKNMIKDIIAKISTLVKYDSMPDTDINEITEVDKITEVVKITDTINDDNFAEIELQHNQLQLTFNKILYSFYIQANNFAELFCVLNSCYIKKKKQFSIPYTKEDEKDDKDDEDEKDDADGSDNSKNVIDLLQQNIMEMDSSFRDTHDVIYIRNLKTLNFTEPESGILYSNIKSTKIALYNNHTLMDSINEIIQTYNSKLESLFSTYIKYKLETATSNINNRNYTWLIQIFKYIIEYDEKVSRLFFYKATSDIISRINILTISILLESYETMIHKTASVGYEFNLTMNDQAKQLYISRVVPSATNSDKSVHEIEWFFIKQSQKFSAFRKDLLYYNIQQQNDTTQMYSDILAEGADTQISKISLENIKASIAADINARQYYYYIKAKFIMPYINFDTIDNLTGDDKIDEIDAIGENANIKLLIKLCNSRNHIIQNTLFSENYFNLNICCSDNYNGSVLNYDCFNQFNNLQKYTDKNEYNFYTDPLEYFSSKSVDNHKISGTITTSKILTIVNEDLYILKKYTIIANKMIYYPFGLTCSINKKVFFDLLIIEEQNKITLKALPGKDIILNIINNKLEITNGPNTISMTVADISTSGNHRIQYFELNNDSNILTCNINTKPEIYTITNAGIIISLNVNEKDERFNIYGNAFIKQVPVGLSITNSNIMNNYTQIYILAINHFLIINVPYLYIYDGELYDVVHIVFYKNSIIVYGNNNIEGGKEIIFTYHNIFHKPSITNYIYDPYNIYYKRLIYYNDNVFKTKSNIYKNIYDDISALQFVDANPTLLENPNLTDYIDKVLSYKIIDDIVLLNNIILKYTSCTSAYVDIDIIKIDEFIQCFNDLTDYVTTANYKYLKLNFYTIILFAKCSGTDINTIKLEFGNPNIIDSFKNQLNTYQGTHNVPVIDDKIKENTRIYINADITIMLALIDKISKASYTIIEKFSIHDYCSDFSNSIAGIIADMTTLPDPVAAGIPAPAAPAVLGDQPGNDDLRNKNINLKNDFYNNTEIPTDDIEYIHGFIKQDDKDYSKLFDYYKLNISRPTEHYIELKKYYYINKLLKKYFVKLYYLFNKKMIESFTKTSSEANDIIKDILENECPHMKLYSEKYKMSQIEVINYQTQNYFKLKEYKQFYDNHADIYGRVIDVKPILESMKPLTKIDFYIKDYNEKIMIFVDKYTQRDYFMQHLYLYTLKKFVDTEYKNYSDKLSQSIKLFDDCKKQMDKLYKLYRNKCSDVLNYNEGIYQKVLLNKLTTFIKTIKIDSDVIYYSYDFTKDFPDDFDSFIENIDENLTEYDLTEYDLTDYNIVKIDDKKTPLVSIDISVYSNDILYGTQYILEDNIKYIKNITFDFSKNTIPDLLKSEFSAYIEKLKLYIINQCIGISTLNFDAFIPSTISSIETFKKEIIKNFVNQIINNFIKQIYLKSIIKYVKNLFSKTTAAPDIAETSGDKTAELQYKYENITMDTIKAFIAENYRNTTNTKKDKRTEKIHELIQFGLKYEQPSCLYIDPEIIKLLAGNAGCIVSKKDSANKQPLEYAIEIMNSEIINILLPKSTKHIQYIKNKIAMFCATMSNIPKLCSDITDNIILRFTKQYGSTSMPKYSKKLILYSIVLLQNYLSEKPDTSNNYALHYDSAKIDKDHDAIADNLCKFVDAESFANQIIHDNIEKQQKDEYIINYEQITGNIKEYFNTLFIVETVKDGKLFTTIYKILITIVQKLMMVNFYNTLLKVIIKFLLSIKIDTKIDTKIQDKTNMVTFIRKLIEKIFNEYLMNYLFNTVPKKLVKITLKIYTDKYDEDKQIKIDNLFEDLTDMIKENLILQDIIDTKELEKKLKTYVYPYYGGYFETMIKEMKNTIDMFLKSIQYNHELLKIYKQYDNHLTTV